MAIVVEDGTGLANAESYVSVADADTYHQLRGNSAWTQVSPTNKEAALRKAADYMRQAYRSEWLGFRVYTTQGLDWPREGVPLVDSYLKTWVNLTTIPQEVKNAQCELALRAVTATLNPDLEQALKSETIGPIKVEYDPYSPPGPVFVSIDQLLAPYLKNSAGSVRLVR